MPKIYIVRLSDDEREICLAVIKKLKGSSGKVRRAHILLQADADGPHWKDQDIALNGKQRVHRRERKLLTANKKHKSSHSVFPIRPKDATVGRCVCSPKHGSWLNITENELSVLTVPCVKGRHFGTMELLRKSVESWSQQRNAK